MRNIADVERDSTSAALHAIKGYTTQLIHCFKFNASPPYWQHCAQGRSTTINQFPSLNTNNKIPNFVELKYLSDHTPKKGVSLADKRVKRAGKSEDLKFMHKAILTKFEYNNVKHLKQILLAC